MHWSRSTTKTNWNKHIRLPSSMQQLNLTELIVELFDSILWLHSNCFKSNSPSFLLIIWKLHVEAFRRKNNESVQIENVLWIKKPFIQILLHSEFNRKNMSMSEIYCHSKAAWHFDSLKNTWQIRNNRPKYILVLLKTSTMSRVDCSSLTNRQFKHATSHTKLTLLTASVKNGRTNSNISISCNHI